MTRAFFLAAVLCAWLFVPHPVAADDAAVLPKGRGTAGLENYFFFDHDERWGPRGKAEDLAAAFNERALDSTVFPLLTPLNALVPGGRASIGDSNVHFEYSVNVLNFTAAYGVTDRLTVGLEVPYYWAHTDVKASVNSAPGSSANVGLRTGPGPGPCAAALPVLPLSCPNTRRFTTEDVQQLLGPGLAGIPGFGFKRLEDNSVDGFGDISVGAKYQYLRTRDWRLAGLVGVRFPTGQHDDPDNLVDYSWSTGAFALLTRLYHDVLLSNLWRNGTLARPGPQVLQGGDLLLNFTFRYDWVMPNHATIRVGDAETLTTNRERVYRDVGDKFEFELGAQYAIWTPFTISALYRYGFKLEDEVVSHRGFDTRPVEKDTDATEHIYIVRANYSTLPLYLQQRFPIPLNVFASYRDRFAGSGSRLTGSPSQVLKTRYISVGLQIMF